MDIHENLEEDNNSKSKMVLEILAILAFSIAVYVASQQYDILEKIVEFSWQHEKWELDELLSVSIFVSIAFVFFSVRRWNDLRTAYDMLLERSKSLQKALSEIKQLRGIIPICASCKKIRDDEGYWHQVESYVSAHSDASFSHSICPNCAKKLYPEFVETFE